MPKTRIVPSMIHPTDAQYKTLLAQVQEGERIERYNYIRNPATGEVRWNQNEYLCLCGRWVRTMAESVHQRNCGHVKRNGKSHLHEVTEQTAIHILGYTRGEIASELRSTGFGLVLVPCNRLGCDDPIPLSQLLDEDLKEGGE